MPIEIVDFPIKNGGSFHCYVSSPEGKSNNSGPGAPGHFVLGVWQCIPLAALRAQRLENGHATLTLILLNLKKVYLYTMFYMYYM